MRRWEVELRNLADDFGLEREDVNNAVKRAKEISVPKAAREPTYRYEYGRRLLLPRILSL